jgi:hypothetical protein
MDAKSFADYYKSVLINESKKYENSLISVSYESIAEAKRISGIRDTLVGISESTDKILSDFYEKGGNRLPDLSSVTKEI